MTREENTASALNLPFVCLAFALRLPRIWLGFASLLPYVWLTFVLRVVVRPCSRNWHKILWPIRGKMSYSQPIRCKIKISFADFCRTALFTNTIQQRQRNAAQKHNTIKRRNNRRNTTQKWLQQTCSVFADQEYQTHQYSPAIGCHLHQHHPPEHQKDEQLGTA